MLIFRRPRLAGLQFTSETFFFFFGSMNVLMELEPFWYPIWQNNSFTVDKANEKTKMPFFFLYIPILFFPCSPVELNAMKAKDRFPCLRPSCSGRYRSLATACLSAGQPSALACVPRRPCTLSDGGWAPLPRQPSTPACTPSGSAPSLSVAKHPPLMADHPRKHASTRAI